MMEWLEEECKKLMFQGEYEDCEEVLVDAMSRSPHSAVPHNLMGILMELEHNHALAMKHFRAAYMLDPTYIPAKYNLEQFENRRGEVTYAFCPQDCRTVKGKKEVGSWKEKKNM